MPPHDTTSFSDGQVLVWQDDARTDFTVAWRSYNNCPRFGFRHKNAASNSDFFGGPDIAIATHSFKFFNNGHTFVKLRGNTNPRWTGSFPRTMAPPSTSFAWRRRHRVESLRPAAWRQWNDAHVHVAALHGRKPGLVHCNGRHGHDDADGIGMRFSTYGNAPNQFPFKGHLRNFKVTSCCATTCRCRAGGTAARQLSARTAPDLTATGNGGGLRCTCSTCTIWCACSTRARVNHHKR